MKACLGLCLLVGCAGVPVTATPSAKPDPLVAVGAHLGALVSPYQFGGDDCSVVGGDRWSVTRAGRGTMRCRRGDVEHEVRFEARRPTAIRVEGSPHVTATEEPRFFYDVAAFEGEHRLIGGFEAAFSLSERCPARLHRYGNGVFVLSDSPGQCVLYATAGSLSASLELELRPEVSK